MNMCKLLKDDHLVGGFEPPNHRCVAGCDELILLLNVHSFK